MRKAEDFHRFTQYVQEIEGADDGVSDDDECPRPPEYQRKAANNNDAAEGGDRSSDVDLSWQDVPRGIAEVRDAYADGKNVEATARQFVQFKCARHVERRPRDETPEARKQAKNFDAFLPCALKDDRPGSVLFPTTDPNKHPKNIRMCNVTGATMLVYEVDGKQPYREAIQELLKLNVAFIAYSTYNHSETNHKFRIVIFIAETIPAELYAPVWKAFKHKLKIDADESGSNVARIYYLPAHDGSPEARAAAFIDTDHFDKNRLSVAAEIEEARLEIEAQAKRAKSSGAKTDRKAYQERREKKQANRAEWERIIHTGEAGVHDAINRLLLSRANVGISVDKLVEELETRMLEAEWRDGPDASRWQDRFSNIRRSAESAYSEATDDRVDALREALAWMEGDPQELEAEVDRQIDGLTKESFPRDIADPACIALTNLVGLLRPDKALVDAYARRICDKLSNGRDKRGGIRDRIEKGIKRAQRIWNDAYGENNEGADDTRLEGAIYYNTHLSEQLALTRAALKAASDSEAPSLFTRIDGTPIRLKGYEGHTTLEPLDRNGWKYELQRVATYRRFTPDGRDIDASPVPDVVDNIMGAPGDKLGLPILRRVVTVPIFAPTSPPTLITTPGYNRALRAYLNTSTAFLSVPETPSPKDVARAVWLLRELALDVPFSDNFLSDPENELPQYTNAEDDDGYRVPNWERGRSSRTNYVGQLLQPVVRELIQGPCPLYWTYKPKWGTGAGLLNDLLLTVHQGAVGPVRPSCDTLEEFNKRWDAGLMSGDDILLFDNIGFHLKSDGAASAATSGMAKIRRFQTHNEVVVEVKQLIGLNGNNLSAEPQLMRRMVPIYIDARMADPSKGRTFKHNAKEWAQAHRLEVVWALHVLVQNWISKGMPRNTVPHGEVLGSFEDYHRTMHGIFSCAGLDGFLSNHSAFMATRNEEGNEPARFLQYLASKFLTNGRDTYPFNSTGDLMMEALDGIATSRKGGEPVFAFDLGVNGKDIGAATKSFGRIVGNWRHPFNVTCPDGKIAKAQIVKRMSGNNTNWVLRYVE